MPWPLLNWSTLPTLKRCACGCVEVLCFGSVVLCMCGVCVMCPYMGRFHIVLRRKRCKKIVKRLGRRKLEHARGRGGCDFGLVETFVCDVK